MTAIAAPPMRPGWLVPAVLMLASTVSILATDLYTPSLPRLTEVFGVPAETVSALPSGSCCSARCRIGLAAVRRCCWASCCSHCFRC